MKVKSTKLKLQVGIDRIELSNLWIKGIDWEILENALVEKPENTIRFTDMGQPYRPDVGMYFSRIEIIDNNVFGKLCIGVAGKLNSKMSYIQTYGKMDFTIKGSCANLQNMSVLVLRKYIRHIKKYVAKNYGIYLSLQDAGIHKMEVNVTIPYVPVASVHPFLKNVLINLKIGGRQYAEYGKIKIAGKGPFSHRVDTSTIIRKNNSKELVFYDKTEQLKNVHGIHVSESLMRIELKLNCAQTMRDKLGHNKLRKLTQEQLNQLFYDYVIKKIEQYQRDYKSEEKKKAKALLIKYRSAGNKSKNHNWPIMMMTEISQSFEEGDVQLLDVSVFKDVCKEVIGPKHGSDVYKRIVACCNQYTPVLNRGYDQKLDLLVDALQKAVKGDETCLIEVLNK